MKLLSEKVQLLLRFLVCVLKWHSGKYVSVKLLGGPLSPDSHKQF